MFIATIDGKEVEISPSDLKPKEEGFGIITPDSVPDGYYRKEAMESKIQERIKKAKENAESDLLEDEGFNKRVLSKYGVQLDDEGKPKGIKTQEDLEQMKKSVAEQIKADYEDKIKQKDEKLNSLLGKGKKSSIIEAASKIGVDGKYLEPLVEGGSPYLVREVEDQFEWNDEIGDYALKDTDGTFAVDGNGFVTAEKFFQKNTEKFKHMLKDQRQRGANFNGQGKPGEGQPKGDPTKWKREQKLDYIEQHGREGYEKLIDKAVADKNSEN